MKWETKHYDELSKDELYEILKLRNEVFVVEQDCKYQDCDDYDKMAHHVMGWQKGKLVAYARMFAPGIKCEDASGGRFATAPAVRNQGMGHQLMEACLKSGEALFGKASITVSAQQYLQKFYESYGFICKGKAYLEDDIPHIKMKRNPAWPIPDPR